MANIAPYLSAILSAVYGEEVRGSIHDALAAMNTEASSAMQFASTAKDSAQASAASAQNSASTATQKANAASASAQAAKTSEVNAAFAAEDAANSASTAVNSASAAKASENAAANSEAVATQKASDATTSANAAAQSAAEALAAENRTKTVKSEVETLSAQSSADKDAAEAAKIAAEAARDAAALSKDNAKSSANTALIAQAAAEVAKDDAEAAKLAATAAKDAAETAKTGAESAADSAESSADDASASATSAAASATSAQQYSGKPPKPQDGSWWIWDADQQKYIDSGISCELEGPTGNGVKDIQLTSGDHKPGTTDVYTLTMTDGTTTTISVYNGRNGTGAGDVLGISFDLILPASGWANGELTIADSRLLALATHKYLIGADEASREEYLDCKVQPRDITTTGFITFKNDSNPTFDLTVNVIRLELAANGA